jgi:DNA adenine methylase
MSKAPHLVQYQGSKRTLARQILQFLPNSIDRLVEPFAGTAAISIATAAEERCHRFWLNDLNQPLIELLKLVIEHPQQIAETYTHLWNEQHSDSISHYFEIREKFNQTRDPQLFLYLLGRCVKGSVRYNAQGLFNQSPDKRRKGTQPATMSKNIAGISSLLKGKCNFTCLDYREVLKQVRPSDLIYLDPPYQGVCNHRDPRYFAGINFDDFVVAIEDLNKRDIRFLISYDGQRGNKKFGQLLPKHLGLQRIELKTGRSSQSTLLGRKETTIESLYLSSNLLDKSLRVADHLLNLQKQLIFS